MDDIKQWPCRMQATVAILSPSKQSMYLEKSCLLNYKFAFFVLLTGLKRHFLQLTYASAWQRSSHYQAGYGRFCLHISIQERCRNYCSIYLQPCAGLSSIVYLPWDRE